MKSLILVLIASLLFSCRRSVKNTEVDLEYPNLTTNRTQKDIEKLSELIEDIRFNLKSNWRSADIALFANDFAPLEMSFAVSGIDSESDVSMVVNLVQKHLSHKKEKFYLMVLFDKAEKLGELKMRAFWIEGKQLSEAPAFPWGQ